MRRAPLFSFVLCLVHAVVGLDAAHGQEHTLTLVSPEAAELVLTVRQAGEVRAHCPPTCEVDLDPGAIELTLHRHRRDEALARIDLSLDVPTRARAIHVDREPERIAGGVVIGLGAVPGAALALVGLLWALAGGAGDAGTPPTESFVLLGVGDALLVAGLVVGLYLAFHFDEDRIDVEPISP